MFVPTLGGRKKDDGSLDRTATSYAEIHNDTTKNNMEERKKNYSDMVNQYYDLATDFYEFGWGQSFHFAPQGSGEPFELAILRHEHYLALQLEIKSGQRILDVGCGVGGPMRNMARLARDSTFVGLNNNAYQISRGTAALKRENLDSRCSFLKADFMNIPESAGLFDAAYAIEATCHAPDPVGCYSQILKCIKPGGLFACYEWCTTDAYNENDLAHLNIKKGIEIGNGLPDIRSTSQVVEALKQAGFEVLDSRDLAKASDIPWYWTLSAGWSLRGFRHTRIGRAFTSYMVKFLEFTYLAPKGSTNVQTILLQAADALVDGGKKDIFTPMFFCLARKPLATTTTSTA